MTAQKPEVQYLTRMTPEQFERFRKQFPPPVVTERTTDTQAAWQLGVACVLEKLRDGYVV